MLLLRYGSRFYAPCMVHRRVQAVDQPEEMRAHVEIVPTPRIEDEAQRVQGRERSVHEDAEGMDF